MPFFHYLSEVFLNDRTLCSQIGLFGLSQRLSMGKNQEIIVAHFSYSGGNCDGFLGHKSINIISSSSMLNKQHNSVSTIHIV